MSLAIPDGLWFFLVSKPIEGHTSCTFRKVWPLELLAFIASCHSLKLNNLAWTGKFNETQNTMHKHTVQENTQTNRTKTSVDCKTNISNNARNIQEGLKQADTRVLHVTEEQTLQRQSLSNLFQHRIKPKKQYEIDVLSKVSKTSCFMTCNSSAVL